MAADVSSTLSAWSSTESSNSPSGTTAVGANLDDNLRMIQAVFKSWVDQTGWGVLNLTSISGTNTLTATLATAGSVTFGPTALSSGMRFRFIPANSNTGATTLNVTSPNGGSALGAKNVYLNGAALVGYELRKNCPVIVDYDGTQFNIIAGAHGGDGIPIGTESNRFFSTAPNGHLLCDGSAVSRTTYADLFAVLSTTYGTGDGSTTFNLPNMQRRVSVGSGGTGTATLANTVGSTGGEEDHTLSAAESGVPAHSHTASTSTTIATATTTGLANAYLADSVDASIQKLTNGANIVNVTDVASSSTTVNNNSAAAASSAHNNLPPSMVVYKAVKY